MRTLVTSLAALTIATAPVLLAGCVADDLLEEGALPDVLEDDAKADSLRSPTDFGHLFFWQHQFAALAPADAVRNISWTFTLGVDTEAALVVTADPADPGPLDLVAYVYKRGADRKWHLVSKAKVGDGAAQVGTSDEITEAGEYRVIVKGRKTTQRDRFIVQLACGGEGCPTDAECVFTGWTPGLAHGSVTTVVDDVLAAADVDRMAEFNQELVQTAIEHATGQRVSSAAEALGLVDDAQVAYRELDDHMSGRSYFQIEGKLAGETFELFFDDEGGRPVAARSADEFSLCEAPADSCGLGQSFGDTAGMPGATVGAVRVIKKGDAMDERTQTRIVTAVLPPRAAHSGDAVDKAFAMARGEFTVEEFSFEGIKVVRVSYKDAAGPMGAYYVDSDDDDASVSPVASLEAGAIRNCTVL